jgi:chemotaxis protein methyltransferase CheR
MVSAFDFDYLRALVRSHSGVVLEPHKDYLARLHLNRLVLQTGCESLAAFIEHLKRSSPGSLHQQAVEALLINETSFFRDYYPFETLKSRILPTLIRSRPAQQPIYIWCAACSNGQEPYSIAILIQEAFPDLANGKVRVIASDLSACVLDRAKRVEAYLPLCAIATFSKWGNLGKLIMKFVKLSSFVNSISFMLGLLCRKWM